LWTDVHSGEPKAIHRRPITDAGVKLDDWRALGPTTGCAIRLWPDDCVTTGLVIGEGPETVASAATTLTHKTLKGTSLRPAWACGDSGHLRAFPVLAGIEALTILTDHDANLAGQKAAAECCARWREAGHEVIPLMPDDEGDFNDVVREASQ
jgi:hypothetical protein